MTISFKKKSTSFIINFNLMVQFIVEELIRRPNLFISHLLPTRIIVTMGYL